jgi:hypothetical protein
MHYGVFALLLFRKKKILSVVEKLKTVRTKIFFTKKLRKKQVKKKKETRTLTQLALWPEDVPRVVGPSRTDTSTVLSNPLKSYSLPWRPLLCSCLLKPPFEKIPRKCQNKIQAPHYYYYSSPPPPPPPPRIRCGNGRGVQPQDGGGGVPGLQGPPRGPHARAHHR